MGDLFYNREACSTNNVTKSCQRIRKLNSKNISSRRLCNLQRTKTVKVELWLFVSLFMSCWSANSVIAVSLLDGRYETTADVTGYLNLAQDIANMNEAEDFDTKLKLYKEGTPRDTPNTITLQSLSLSAEEEMKENPFYHMFRYAFWDLGYNKEGEDDGFFDGSPVEVYADTVVQDLFALEIPQIESNAALVMNVWMAAVHGVFQALAHCKAKDSEAGIAALDKAAALWIGAGQEEGSNEKGHLLYNMAENAGERFGQDNGETDVNEMVMIGLVELQTALAGGACENTSSFDQYAALRTTVSWLTGIMTVPLVQNLIHHTINIENEGGSNMVELYALGIVPRIATCHPNAYEALVGLNVLNDLSLGDEDKAIKVLQQAYSCLGLTCQDVGTYMGGVVPTCRDIDVTMPFTRGGYTAVSKASLSKSNIDKDILQIDVFLKYGAVSLAHDWYAYGWNSDLSLKRLAKNEYVPELPSSEASYFSLFSDYYESSNPLHERITDLLNGRDDAIQQGSASVEQFRMAITGLFEYVIMFVAIADSLKYAAFECKGSQELARKYLDSAAVFYIGSMEGADLNSIRYHDGKSLFSKAHESCSDFGTCVGSGDHVGSAAINEVLVNSLTAAANSIDSSNCQEVESLVNEIILPGISVPLIQGTLKYAFINEKLKAGTRDGDLALGDSISRGILPIVNAASPDSAKTIKSQMEFQLATQPVPNGFKSVMGAFRGDTLSLLGIECLDIGTLETEEILDAMCGDGVTPPASHPNSYSTEIAFGRYIFSDLTEASKDAAFALDVREMFHADTAEIGKDIYIKGSNALRSNVFGDIVDGTPSLASLSTFASLAMNDDPTFNIYKYALYQDSDFETSSGEDFSYANDIVIEALKNGIDPKLAAESTVILHVFMVIAHKLHNAVRFCDQKMSGVSEIDSAVALWIGDRQSEGQFDDGWMMYSIGQSVHEFFGYAEGEAPVNTRLMDLFVEAQQTAKGCVKSSNSVKQLSHESSKLRYLSRKILVALTESLIKSLLFHMIQNSKNMVELYAVAAIPQAAACDPQAYRGLQSALFSGYSQQTSITDELLDDLAIFLRCQQITCRDIETGSNADESLKDLSKQLCKRLGDGLDSKHPLASYTPAYPVDEEARLDLDAVEMVIMMRTQAYDAAIDVYRFGQNLKSHNGSTLSSFASGTDNKLLADTMIYESITKSKQYAKSTREMSAEIVKRTLQSTISLNAVLGQMNSSLDQCNAGSIEEAREDWDKAVAYFVGSTEGRLAGGKTDQHGVFLYALANEFCDDFSLCEASGEAKVNQELLFNFASGRDSLADGECNHLNNLVPDIIAPKLMIPLIQGVVGSALHLDNDPNDPEVVATAHVLSMTLLPYIERVSAKSASVLRDSFGSFPNTWTDSSTSGIIQAFGSILDLLGISCDDIGNPAGFSLCVADVTGDTPTNLADNLYITTTYVQDRANIALDVMDISEALAEGNVELAQLIYRKGKNSEQFDVDGKFLRTRTLKQFSTLSTNDMFDEPEFNMFMYTLQNQMYADTLVEAAIANSRVSNSEVATEAVAALNVWMEIVHLMHETLQACKEKKTRDEEGVFLMDAAVAYWIGDGQVAGDGDNGHLLYALTERFGESFNVESAGQSRTNSNILRLFNEAKNEVSLPNACSENQTTYKRLRSIVNRLISQMTIPLIQGLILSLRTNDRTRVKIYSHAFVPLVTGCRPHIYDALKQKLLSKDDYNVVEVELIIDLIRQSYDCLGLQCEDVGYHETDLAKEAPKCHDPDVDSSLAGYRPASDVRDYSRLDLDIREMDVLLQMKAYSAADDLYTYGKHARGASGVTSIGQLATTKHRSFVPEFDAFVRYYSEDTYADDIIRSALDPSQSMWLEEQLRTVVLKASQVLVMYFAALQNAYEAVSDCREENVFDSGRDTIGSSESWDRAAAILIGSLEGTEEHGSIEGYMFYDLAQKYCLEFGTCRDNESNNDINEDMISLLYTGRGAALGKSCRALEKAADELSSLLLIPIIQGALSTSTVLSRGENSEQRAEAYVYSRALIPFVRRRSAARDLDLYLGNPGPSDKRHTASRTYAALATAYPKMDVDCEEIGIAHGVDTCSGVVYVTDYIFYVIGVVTCLLFCCCGGIFYSRHKRRTVRRPENNPKFFRSHGEFNHGVMNHSMDLLEKAFTSKRLSKGNRTPSSTPEDTDEEIEALNRRYINSRAEALDNNSDTFSDEDDSDHFEEVIALTSHRSGDII